MKHRRGLYGVLAAAALVLAGCQGEPGEGPATGGGEVRFSGGIAGMTRAAGTQWDAGDTIGISAAEGAKYVNRGYRTAAGGATGAFQPVGEADRIYYETAGSENFKAYYPYSSSVTADAPYITASTADQSRQKEFDFLYGEGSGSRNRPEVSLTFAHRMARFVLTIVPGDGTSLDEVKAATYTLSNLAEEGQFNAFTGEATATGEAVTGKTLAGTETDAGVTCDLILFPQQFVSDNLTVTANLDGQTLEVAFDFSLLADNGGNRLVGGTQYNLTIRVKKTGMTVGDCTITEWGDAGTLENDAEATVYIGNKTAAEAAVGDFYMRDGTLVGKDDELTAEQQAACIGIVYSTDLKRIGEAALKALQDKGVTPHGQVMALTNASEGCRWGAPGMNESIPNANQASNMYPDYDGKHHTNLIIDTYGNDEAILQNIYTAFYHASRYGTKDSGTARYAAPENTTGWFVPAIGQWWDILTNLGGADFKGYEQFPYPFASAEGGYAAINKQLGKIEGATPFKSGGYWSSSEYDENQGCEMNLSSMDLMSWGKSLTVMVRCCLAF